MAIAEDDIERVRAAQPISAVIGNYVTLKRAGRNFQGLCPFHGEKTPSFNVRDETGRYKCFGCGASGDVFKFVQEVERIDFVGAVEHLAAKVGVTLNYTQGGPSRDRQRNKELLEVMERAVAPTLVETTDPAFRTLREEIFGPVAPLVSFSDESRPTIWEQP